MNTHDEVEADFMKFEITCLTLAFEMYGMGEAEAKRAAEEIVPKLLAGGYLGFGVPKQLVIEEFPW